MQLINICFSSLSVNAKREVLRCTPSSSHVCDFFLFKKKKAVKLLLQHAKENTLKKNSVTYTSQNLNIFQYITSDVFSHQINYTEYISSHVACKKKRKNTKKKFLM